MFFGGPRLTCFAATGENSGAALAVTANKLSVTAVNFIVVIDDVAVIEAAK